MGSIFEEQLLRLEGRLRQEFPDIPLEFTWQTFTNHAELWVYVLKLDAYNRVRERCDELEKETPDVWVMPMTWTGPWPGGESEQEVSQRREDFKHRHNINVAHV